MGVERGVTRWFVRRQMLLDEIAGLEAKLLPARENTQPLPDAEQMALKLKLAEAQEKLRVMGACPRPMMG